MDRGHRLHPYGDMGYTFAACFPPRQGGGMPWKVRDAMSLRQEFVEFAESPELNFAQLCRRFGISRKTGYKWLSRHREQGMKGLEDESRRPHHSPRRSPAKLEKAVVELRRQRPTWGGRKIRRRLLDKGWPEGAVCAASTITEIVRRHGLLGYPTSSAPGGWKRFEASEPNELWQMDFKGHFEIQFG